MAALELRSPESSQPGQAVASHQPRRDADTITFLEALGIPGASLQPPQQENNGKEAKQSLAERIPEQKAVRLHSCRHDLRRHEPPAVSASVPHWQRGNLSSGQAGKYEAIFATKCSTVATQDWLG